MTLGAAGCVSNIEPFHAEGILLGRAPDNGIRLRFARQSCVKVELMALEAEERLILDEEVVCDAAMNGVADAAVFHNGFVFKDIRALSGSVALPTKVIHILGGGFGWYEISMR